MLEHFVLSQKRLRKSYVLLGLPRQSLEELDLLALHFAEEQVGK